MKAYGYILLFVVVLLLPFALRGTIGDGGRPRDVAGARRLVVITPNNQDIRQEFAWAFEAWHRARYGEAVTIDYRVPGGASDIKRQLEMVYRGGVDQGFVPDYDVLWGGGDFFFEHELKPLGVFQPLGVSKELLREVFPEPALAGVRLYDGAAEPQWAGVAVSGFGIVWNPDLYGVLGLDGPTTWADLTRPELAGMVALADPTHSGSVAIAYAMIVQRAMADEEEKVKGLAKDDPAYRAALARGWKRGMGQLLLMAANARYFTAAATQVPADVGTGEAAAGVSIDLYARVSAEVMGERRVRYVMPVGATAVTPDPVGILAGVRGERLELARRFVEFLLSREGQRLWALKVGEPGGPRERALRRSPVRRDVYADRRGWSDDVDPFGQAGGFNQRAEWMGQFGDMRSLWRAAWIDSRSELKEAYAAVLAVRDEGRRRELLARLADLPVEMSDLDRMRAGRRKVQADGGDVEEWKAREMIGWAERFRGHYRRVRGEARR
jgi:ABC-type Fe3+ transport system substrate-binding protein